MPLTSPPPGEPTYLSMPDPPGATRMEVIAAKLKAAQGDSTDLDEVYARIDAAQAELDKTGANG